ncbi:MAG: type II secretion system protein GspG [Phycisphaerales bacterium]|nr:type II secretion system protein GspG [Phycisphaerales bacterium]
MSTAPARSRRVRVAPGFSLIELTLVIVILGVLMSVVAVNVVGQGKKAKVRATKVTMDTIRTQLDSYNLEYSAYPPTLETLQKVPGFLSDSKPIKDGWGRQLAYQTPGRNNRPYDLLSNGDNLDDIGDDIDVWLMDQEQ